MNIQLPVEQRLAALQQLDILRICSPAELIELAEAAQVLFFADGETIVREGETGLGFYLVISGSAEVRRGDVLLNRIAAGGFFGEIALLEGVPRTADVIAVGDTTCLGIMRSDFRNLLVREPRVAMEILEEEGRRLHDRPLLDSPRSKTPLPE
ncbi:MAG: hypothetical protein NVSMB57_15220 [Actinomycetota bacterium]